MPEREAIGVRILIPIDETREDVRHFPARRRTKARGLETTTMEALLRAIVDDDRNGVEVMLAGNPSLAARLVSRPKLYQAKIFHWLYAGDTALHLAAAGYRVEIARLLLRAGADPSARSNHRRSSPLHYAADGYITGPVWNAKRQLSTIECLLDAGADINGQDMNGATPLHRATRTRCVEAVRYLLKAGADPLLKNKPGSAPFHLAVQNTGRGGSGAPQAVAAQREIINEFLSFGLSPELKTSGGKTVRDCAKSTWIRELLACSEN
ncbi:MAG TPA: ankyrin repeat domain-containing protein [Candidatus Limnocylindrales bacterium]|nr:ankyrin repeat domain-containing protein [Candidatus Limnocylindrales bacterium]